MPYRDLPDRAFWKSCRKADDFLLRDMYEPGFDLVPEDRIATVGSCFAQHISRFLRQSELNFHDVEPTPRGMPEEVARRFGYGLYSARYGNIYTPRQLLQLIDDAIHAEVRQSAIWERDGRWFDALRPGVEPLGLGSVEEVAMHRFDHLRHVRRMFESMDVLVITLGLTEAWHDRVTKRVFPTAPGVIAGEFDLQRHGFINFSVAEVRADMDSAIARLRDLAPNLRIILTVSPVPLTATASGQHVLQATHYSKAVLRAVAGELASEDPLIDYFPSFEIVSGLPFGRENFADNLRHVSADSVDRVMAIFFRAHGVTERVSEDTLPPEKAPPENEEICEEALLEAFAGE